VRVRNDSDTALIDAPVDLTLGDGRRFTVLVTVGSGQVVTIYANGN
jgi:hypothetical protein